MIPDMNKYKIREKISSGIYGYDEMIDGGFLNQTVNLISGESGTGKTVFGTQFLYRGALEGKTGLCILTTKSSLSLKATMFSSFYWDLFRMEKLEMIVFVDYSDPHIRLLSFKYKNPSEYILDFIIQVRNSIEYLQPDLVYLDSIDSMFIFIKRRYTLKILIDKLFDTFRSYNITSVVTVGTNFQIESILEDSADSTTRLNRIVSGNKLKRLIYVSKARGIRTTNDIRELEISDNGIIILDKSPYLAD